MTSYSLPDPARRKAAISAIVFLLIALAGLTYVKWWPYYHKALAAAAKHTIGSSILKGAHPAVPDPSWSAAWDYAVAYYKSVWKAAVLGILLGSLVQVLIPQGWLMRLLGKASFRSTAISGVASLPGMMCTCCAAPLAVGLRKQNVSVGAALAFWLGNPTLNPATLIFMTFVLSWKFTVLRLVMGLILVFGVSYLANRFADPAKVPGELLERTQDAGDTDRAPLLIRWLIAVWKMAIHLIPAYVIAVLLLGAFRAWMFPTIGETAANSLLLIVFFSIVGALFVIPTAAEIPIMQALMSAGYGAGVASALSITLPSLSLPSLLMVAKAFPRRALVFVSASVVLIGVVSGILGMLLL